MPQKIKVMRAQYDARLDEMMDAFETRPDVRELGRAHLHTALEAFKNSVEVVETAAAARPAARRTAKRPATETAPPRRSDEEIRQIVERRVAEAVAAGKAPGAPAAAQPTPRPAVPPLHQLPGDVLDAVAVESVTGNSPFWRPRATPAADRVAESAPSALPEPGRPLHTMNLDEFFAHSAAAFTAFGAAAGFGSPSWAA